MPEGTRSDDFPSTPCSHPGGASLLRSRAGFPDWKFPIPLASIHSPTHTRTLLGPGAAPQQRCWQPGARSCLSSWAERALTTDQSHDRGQTLTSPGLPLLLFDPSFTCAILNLELRECELLTQCRSRARSQLKAVVSWRMTIITHTRPAAPEPGEPGSRERMH